MGGKGLGEALFGEGSETEKRKVIRSQLEVRVQRAGEAPNEFNKLTLAEQKAQDEIGTTVGSAGNFKEFIERSSNREKIIGKGDLFGKSTSLTTAFDDASTAQGRLSAFDQSKAYAEKLTKLRGQASNTPAQNAAIEAQLADLASFTAAQEQVSVSPSGKIQASNATVFRQNAQRKQQEIDQATVNANIKDNNDQSQTVAQRSNTTTFDPLSKIPEFEKITTGVVTALQTNSSLLAEALQKATTEMNTALSNFSITAETSKAMTEKINEAKASMDAYAASFTTNLPKSLDTAVIKDALEENRKALAAKAEEIANISIPKEVGAPKAKGK